MKGLIKTSLILAALIVVGIITSIILPSNLSNRVAATHKLRFEEGRTQGYEAGFREGGRAGYQEGSKIGYAMSQNKDISDFREGFYFTYNPTYDEMQAILAESKKTTAMGINYYAEANGIRTAYVRVQIGRKAAEGKVWVYELVAFETVDRGLIFIEPQSDREVELVIGESYWRSAGGIRPIHYDDTVVEVRLLW